MGDINRQGDQEVNIVDKTTQDYAAVDVNNRLKVIAQLESGSDSPVFGLQSFIPHLIYNASGTSLVSGTYTSILNVSGTEGKLDFIAVSGANSNFQVRVDIDSVTVYDVSMAELNVIGLANAVNVDIWAETANKNFRFRPNIPIDFNNSVDVYAKATGTTLTAYYLVSYREAGGD